MNGYSTLKFNLENGIAIIHLDRPEAANGFNFTMASELAAVARHCDMDSDIKVVLLTAEGRFFSAGGDIKSMALAEDVALEVKCIADEFHQAVSTFQRMKAPFVVAVNGICAGAGFSLAVSGDFVFAAVSANFCMAYTKIGFTPDGGATYFLPRLVGLRRTQELLFSNRILSSSEALEWGLITSVVDDSDLIQHSKDFANSLGKGPIDSYSSVKKLLLKTYENSLESQMNLEAIFISAAANSKEGREGVRAFLSKKSPSFN